MATMTVQARTEPGRLTRADLDALPDDGLRHELLDGSIIMTPAPGMRHQRAILRLAQVLAPHVPDHLEMFLAPFDTALPTGDVLQPDILLVRDEVLTEKDVTGVPTLVIEIFSPSTRRRDVGDKLTAYRDAGVPHYWVVDPVAPRLMAHRLVDEEYVVVADVAGDDSWTSTEPVAVTITPSALVSR